MTTLMPLAPALVGADSPSRSPLCGTALPDFEMRAPTTMLGKLESFISGVIAIESSSENETGRSLTCLRRIASGIRGPCAARAKMNTTSSGATCAASAGLSLTVPATAAPGNAATVAAAGAPGVDPEAADDGGTGDAAATAGAAGPSPPRARASAMLLSIEAAIGASGGTVFLS